MRLPLLALGLAAVLLTAPAQAATKIDDPAKFVTGVYTRMMQTKPSDTYAPPTDIYTARLDALFKLDQKESGGEVGRIDFDFWSNAQDYQITGLKVTSHAVENAANRRVVIATFKNMNTPEKIYFYFEKTAAGWKLDDVRAAKDWTLSVILKYGWDE
ncbi:MAG: DUF3828 domain-containing protein [Alphaproteobacteria bacterium]|nr:DUF3828 domain-containing protein [Alphaproteobacteria bacterium]MBV9418277.1 DUF3828 domain-containing protein [Alphaproteobacteria bacterium]